MGICADRGMTPDEAAQAKASRKLDKELGHDQASDMQIIKLLLLGAGESGKSTLFKALITIYGAGYNDEERIVFIPTVRTNAVSAMTMLVENTETLGPVETEDGKIAKTFFDEKKDEILTEETTRHIKHLWADPGVQSTYAQRANFQLVDSAAYFFDHIDRISEENYMPNKDDILRCRIRTTGITETTFIIDGVGFRMIDVGGQRNERKKWIHCFEGVTAIIFVAALSEYDQVLFEDEEKNRMEEALELFDEICNSNWFGDTAILLFLNKRDLFEEKIDRVPLTVCDVFKDYTGEGYEEGVTYIQDCYCDKNQNMEKDIYCHITCATDVGNVEAVFDAVKDIIIRASLQDAGLV